MERQEISSYKRMGGYERRHNRLHNKNSKNYSDDYKMSYVDIFIRQALVAGIIFVVIFILKTLPDKKAKCVMVNVKKGVNYNMNISKQTKAFDKYLDKFFKNTKMSGVEKTSKRH